MSKKHPIIAITGSSGAGTTTVTQTFEHIFRREKVKPVIVEGDAFHRYDRLEMRELVKEANERGNSQVSHFGPDANLFEELESLFKSYGESGGGKMRKYLHDEEEAAPYQQKPGTFTPWADVEPGTDLLFYEGLHGGVIDNGDINIACHTDLLDRRRPDHQPRMDPEAPPRPAPSRLHATRRWSTRSCVACRTT